ncbi:MAG: glycosyltransferase [bacterium]
MRSISRVQDQHSEPPEPILDHPGYLEQGKRIAGQAPGFHRPRVEGKFLYVGQEKFWVKGVTYGTFRPDATGQEFHDPVKVEKDFTLMARNGFNAVRTYTAPPRWLLDLAHRHGLRVMVGLAWEEHIAFLDQPTRARSIVERVRAQVRSLSGHPAVLCFVVGNEIPASIVRWHGPARIRRFIRKLYEATKQEDPEALVTYVNYPTTEFLNLDFLDLACFNVYLESRERLRAYLARLQNLAGNRPLVMAEIGLDSRRNGTEAQAHSLSWQIQETFASGCVGAFVFAWTDEWYRGGYDIEDWDFGITTRQRKPKPALEAVRKAFSEVPFPQGVSWPQISVVVCSYNGSRTIRDTLEGLQRLQYPCFEIIVVDDGSTDNTAQIASSLGARVISVPNGGLSKARNIGLEAARGEIIAYIDDDAYPDPHWLQYLAWAFLNSQHVGIGGPNIPPGKDGPIAQCVANAPGGPIHVLVSDQEAEHIPGCNMAFRKDALLSIGGFDPRFRIAGDDVDVCWRLQEKGWSIGYCPAAVVWHHRRNSIKAYWKQQKNYGRAEALLEEKWPHRYNTLGHLSWKGRLYGSGLLRPLPLLPSRIYQGVWGTAPFQSVYGPSPGLWLSLPMMPEWYLVLLLLVIAALLGFWWEPLKAAWWLLGGGLLCTAWQALGSAARADFSRSQDKTIPCWVLKGVTATLFLLQPLARLWGRLKNGLSPWRRRGQGGMLLPFPRTRAIWSENWESQAQRLKKLESSLKESGALVRAGGDYDSWDLEVRGGLLGKVRLQMALEEHGAGKQQVLVRFWPVISPYCLAAMAAGGVLALAAFLDKAWGVGGIILLGVMLLGWGSMGDCGWAAACCQRALEAKNDS